MHDDPGFIHLRLHSAYSLLRGAIHIKALPKLCLDAGMPAVAVTDVGNLFGALEFSETAARAGIQPIVGGQFDLAFAPPPRPGERPEPPAPVILLAQSETGYANLIKLASDYYLLNTETAPHLPLDLLRAHADGLICLTGGADGPLGRLIRDKPSPTAPRRSLADRLAGACSPGGSTSRSSAIPRTARRAPPAEAATVRARRHRADGLPGYFLIVAWTSSAWAKAQGIPVGPGRGSGAGSLVAYALRITDLDPLRFGLLFERFLNPERVSMPGLRHRLLPGPPRRGDRLRAPEYGARLGGADHHLRQAAGAARCATSAACWACPMARSTRSPS
jgi:DNA polymerase III alpha subunit